MGGSECEIKCKAGYSVGATIAASNQIHLKCQGTTVATGAWKQRDNPSDSPPACQEVLCDALPTTAPANSDSVTDGNSVSCLDGNKRSIGTVCTVTCSKNYQFT